MNEFWKEYKFHARMLFAVCCVLGVLFGFFGLMGSIFVLCERYIHWSVGIVICVVLAPFGFMAMDNILTKAGKVYRKMEDGELEYIDN